MSSGVLWLKVLHIVAFAAWMASLWYLPRLLVYHSDTKPGTDSSETFKLMESRLLRTIGRPSMLVTILAGLALVSLQGFWSSGWLHAKLLFVVGLAVCHGLLERDVGKFAKDQRPRTAKWYRVFNEAPTVLFVIIVVLVVTKPF